MIKQNVYLLPENLDQLSNLIIDFVLVLILLIDIVNFSLGSIAVVNLYYLELIKLLHEHKILYQLL